LTYRGPGKAARLANDDAERGQDGLRLLLRLAARWRERLRNADANLVEPQDPAR